jgi:hypothetical protein
VAGGLWIYISKFNWIEALILTAIGFLIAGIFHFIGIYSMTYDQEIWSGKVIDSTYIPAWTEYYEEAIYRTEYYTETETYTNSRGETETRTVSKTREVFSHWEPRTRYHSECYSYRDTLNNDKSIDEHRYEDIKQKFGSKVNVSKGRRSTISHNSRMISGDPNDYTTINTTNYIYPVHEKRNWQNKIKACPSVFSFPKVPLNIKVYEYPKVNDQFSSNRIINTPISLIKWDQLNAELGPMKKVNLIIINFGEQDESISEWQRAKWIGGKKNDLVLCYGGLDVKWAKVFGWTEKEIVKINLEQLLLQDKINDDIVPKIKEIVISDYIIKDWRKFDYLSVEIPTSIVLWYILGLVVVCSGFVFYSLKNEFDKSNKEESLIKSLH